jgi:lipoyl(octanoyl) transferase
MTAAVEVRWLPPAPYQVIWDLQRRRAAAVAAGDAPEVLYLLEHAPVYTLGRRADAAHLLRGADALRALGAEVVWTDRGGDATWHGPGQLVGYSILNLARVGRDLHAYVVALEQVLIDALGTYGVAAERATGMPGVWVRGDKVAAVGIKVTRGWVSYHGFALNVAPELAWFDHIVPCGLHGVGVTSLAKVLGRAPPIEEVANRVVAAFAARFAAAIRQDALAR